MKKTESLPQNLSSKKMISAEALREQLLACTPVKKQGRGFVHANEAKRHFYKGLLPTLEASFWSDYEYIENKTKQVGESGLSFPGEGLIRGTLVHEELERYAKEKDQKAYLRRLVKEDLQVHSYSKQAMLLMHERGWTPLLAEYPICDREGIVATAFDMLALDKDGRIIGIDWKTGYTNSRERASGPMTTDLFGEDGLTNSPLHQAFMQLCLTVLFFEQMTSLTVDEAYVIYLNEKTKENPTGAEAIVLDPKIDQLRSQLYAQVLLDLASAPPKKEKKKAAKKQIKQNAKKRQNRAKKTIAKRKKGSHLF
jgi:hypothetical protein